jgi:hypothetical protein
MNRKKRIKKTKICIIFIKNKLKNQKLFFIDIIIFFLLGKLFGERRSVVKFFIKENQVFVYQNEI